MSSSPETNNPRPAAAAHEQNDPALDREEQEALGTIQSALDTETQQTSEVEVVKTDDKEILGQSVHLRRSIHDVTRSFLNGSQQSIAGWKNELSQPRNVYLELRRDYAKRKYERKQARVGTSHFKFINKRYDRVAQKHRDKYNRAGTKYSNHTSMMKERIKGAAKASNERDVAYKKRIDMYVERKIDAERRKLNRKLKREQKEQGMGIIDRHRFIRDLSETEKRRITREAIAVIRKENIRKNKLEADYVVPE
jgi:hypothetical protein